MKRPANVRKFKLVMGLVGVLVVGVVGYTLWFVNHSEKVANDAYAKSNNSYTVKPAKKVATTSTRQYLTIKEWGVKLPYGGTDTFTYQIKSGTNNDGVQVISQNLSKTYGCKNYGAGSLARYSSGDAVVDPGGDTAAQLYAAHSGIVAKLGNYYYLFVHDQAQCNDAHVDVQNAANDAIKAALQKLQPMQYLTIKEWGVKISVDDAALANAIYKAPKTLPGVAAGVESVTLATKSTASMDFTCGGEGTGDPITHATGDDQDALLRAKTPAILSTGSNNSPSTFVHIGSYYYAYQHNTGHGECGITSSTLAAEARAASNAFAQSSIVAE